MKKIPKQLDENHWRRNSTSEKNDKRLTQDNNRDTIENSETNTWRKWKILSPEKENKAIKNVINEEKQRSNIDWWEYTRLHL